MKADWKLIPLRDLCDNYKSDIVDGPFGANLKRTDYAASGIPVLKIQNIKPHQIVLKKMDYVSPSKYAELKRHSFKAGDIIMTKLGEPLGISAIVDGIPDGLIVADLVRIRANKIDTKYLCYHLNSPQTTEFINARQKGATRPRVQLNNVRDLLISVAPGLEQHRIVAVLDEAFAGLATVTANAEKNIKNARELFESYLNANFTRSPAGWKTISISECAAVFDGPHATPKTVEAGPVFLGISALKDGVVDLSETRHVTADDFQKWTRRVKPQVDDIVFSYETRLGQAAIIPKGLECCLGRRMGLVRVDRATIEPRFFLYQYLSAHFQRFLRSRTIRGATVDRISIKEFPKYPMWIAPLSEQRKIVQELDRLAADSLFLQSKYKHRVSVLAELRRSILQKAFSGELTSPPSHAIKEAAE